MYFNVVKRRLLVAAYEYYPNRACFISISGMSSKRIVDSYLILFGMV